MNLSREHYDESAKFHGHYGPGLAIGFRAADQALSDLDVSLDQTGALVCVTETQTCPSDAIQVCLGLTFGKGGINYLPTGKIAFSFFHKDTHKSVRYLFKAHKPKGMKRDEWEEAVLTKPFEELFEVSTPHIDMPQELRLWDDLQCDECHEWISEHRKYEVGLKTLCYECALKASKIDPDFQNK